MTDPARFISGFTQDQKTQPLGNLGVPDPFWYIQDFDDFTPYVGTEYEITASGAGSVSSYGVPGGAIIISGAAGTANTIGIQRDIGYFDLTQGKKFGYVARLGLNGSSISDMIILLGLCPITNNVMAINAPGVYLAMSNVDGSFGLRVSDGTANVLLAEMPFIPSVGGYFDVGFSYDPEKQELVGWSGVGLVGQRTLDPNTVALGPTCRLHVPQFPTGLMSPTIGLSQLQGTTQNFSLDFHGTFMER